MSQGETRQYLGSPRWYLWRRPDIPHTPLPYQRLLRPTSIPATTECMSPGQVHMASKVGGAPLRLRPWQAAPLLLICTGGSSRCAGPGVERIQRKTGGTSHLQQFPFFFICIPQSYGEVNVLWRPFFVHSVAFAILGCRLGYTRLYVPLSIPYQSKKINPIYVRNTESSLEQ